MDDTILDQINDAIETEKQKVVPSMSVEEFLDSLDTISDDEINDCTATDEHTEECEYTSKDVDSCGTSDAESRHSSCGNISDYCKSDDQPTSDINNNTNEIIIVSDDDDVAINDERSLVTIGNSTIQQTVILTFQRTLTTIGGQTYVSDYNIEQDIYEHLIH